MTKSGMTKCVLTCVMTKCDNIYDERCDDLMCNDV